MQKRRICPANFHHKKRAALISIRSVRRSRRSTMPRGASTFSAPPKNEPNRSQTSRRGEITHAPAGGPHTFPKPKSSIARSHHEDQAFGGQKLRAVNEIMHDRKEIMPSVDEDQIELFILADESRQHGCGLASQLPHHRSQISGRYTAPRFISARLQHFPHAIDFNCPVLFLIASQEVDRDDLRRVSEGQNGLRHAQATKPAAGANFENPRGSIFLDQTAKHERALEISRAKRCRPRSL